MKFIEKNINEKTKKILIELGFDEMMPIQEKTIDNIMEGKDIVGQAQTGTGKTAAFVIPILEMLETSKGTISLVISPTRELAIQIVEEFRKLGKYHNFTIAPIVGGMDIRRQATALKAEPSIIVATPGRLLDHLGRKRINMENIKTFVIDEVDEMFKSGFKDEIDKIIKYLPKEKQMLLFSATTTDNVKKVANETCDNPVYISVSSGMEATDTISQYAIILKEKQKLKTLVKLIQVDNPECAIIFGRTKRRAKELTEVLKSMDIVAESLHGDMTQRERNTVMKKVKEGNVHILVATDVAARGIDIQNITHIYNFDLPQEVEYYVHRIGRTGRAGKKGVAVSFVKDVEMSHLEKIEKQTNSKIKIIPSPTGEELKSSNKEKILNDIKDLISDTNVKYNQEIIDELISKYSSEKIISVLIDKLLKKEITTEITLTGEPPVKTGSSKGRSSRGRSGSNRSGNRSSRSKSRNSRENGNKSSGERRYNNKSKDQNRDSRSKKTNNKRKYRK